MTVVPISIYESITAIILLAVLSGTGMRNALPDLRTTPPNTNCPLTGWPLIFAPTELAQVDLDSLVSIAELRAAILVHEHGLCRTGLSPRA